ALFPDGEDRSPRLKDKSDQAWTLTALANSYSLSGQPRRAMPLFEQVNVLCEKLGNKRNLAIGLGNVAHMAQIYIGALQSAEANLRRSIAISQEIKDEECEGTGHYELGHVLAYTGKWSECSQALNAGEAIKKQLAHVQAQGLIWSYRALRELLRLRHAEVLQSAVGNRQSAISHALRALELAKEWEREGWPNAYDFMRAHWMLGAAHRIAGQHDEAERHLHEALERCRCINAVETEADILIDLARLRATTPSVSSGQAAADEAQRLAEEALLITERSDYVLQGADAHLELAKLALARGNKTIALHHATEARRLATCDGPPDYTYKVAYDEAGALLEEIT
ncbi:MAG: tetratricopeptide repeat protein, partial [Anaerolineales bacterium]|nr:tetratricopeptide repeat protein [Anaerolineales bacterium]